jgi:hypothetical protein
MKKKYLSGNTTLRKKIKYLTWSVLILTIHDNFNFLYKIEKKKYFDSLDLKQFDIFCLLDFCINFRYLSTVLTVKSGHKLKFANFRILWWDLWQLVENWSYFMISILVWPKKIIYLKKLQEKNLPFTLHVVIVINIALHVLSLPFIANNWCWLA